MAHWILVALFWMPILSWAQAQAAPDLFDRSGLRDTASRSAWDVTVGVGAVGEPRYPGSKRYLLHPFPYIAIRYGDLLWIGVEGIRINVIRLGGFRAGPLLRYEDGRQQTDDTLLQNLPNIPPSIDAGAFAIYKLGSFEFLALAQQAVLHRRNGLTGAVRMTYREQFSLFGKSAYVESGPEIEFANREYETTWFGITSFESTRSGLREFSPSAGLLDVGLRSSLTIQESKHILVRGVVNFKELTGNAGDSPLTTSKSQWLVGAGVGYRF
jgi:outer membrane scaffolding protein for murein synthesis (MipA/OmpV family)